jgi:hypothetical protein
MMDKSRRTLLQFICGIFLVPESALGDSSRKTRIPGAGSIAPGVKASSADCDAIQRILRKYYQAMCGRDADAAISCVGSETLEWYDEKVHLARTASLKALELRDLMTHLIVVRIRHDFTSAQVRRMTGARLFWHAVGAGKFDRRIVSRLASHIVIDRCHRHEDCSWCTIKDAPPDIQLSFVVEDGAWKVDLTPAFPRLAAEMEDDFQDWNCDRLEFIEAIVGTVSRRIVDPTVVHRPTD